MNIRRIGTLAALMMAVMLIIAACGGNGGGGTGDGGSGAAQVVDGKITIDMDEYNFIPQNFEAPVGQQITIELNNVGKMAHDMKFDTVDAQSELVGTSESTTLAVRFDEAGEYPFHCTVPGHKEAGMVGKVIAK